jgi:hypothetical protein
MYKILNVLFDIITFIWYLFYALSGTIAIVCGFLLLLISKTPERLEFQTLLGGTVGAAAIHLVLGALRNSYRENSSVEEK